MNTGILYAALAFFCWGLFPLYFHALGEVPPTEILAHRMVWSLLFLAVVLLWRRQWGWLAAAAGKPRLLAGFAASAVLMAANWGIYIWSVNHDRVVDASLGYFITPLVNVLLGYFVLKERPRRAQWVALAIAAAGVLWLTLVAGSLPWVGLTLAATFGLYGLMRKTAPLGALEGLTLETLLLAPVAGALAGDAARLAEAGFDVEYFFLVEAESMRPLEALPPPSGGSARLVAAARLGNVRLLDNLPVPPEGAAAG